MTLRLLVAAILLNVSTTCAQSVLLTEAGCQVQKHQNPLIDQSEDQSDCQEFFGGCCETLFIEYTDTDIWGSSRTTIPWSKYSINILKKPNYALHQPRSGGTKFTNEAFTISSFDFVHPVIDMTGFLFTV